MSKIWAFCIILVIFGSLFGQEGAEYLIITHDDFAQTINSLAEWKYMKGLQTRVVKLSEIGEDPSNDSIRNFIITAYNTWDPQPQYVLLVGDLSFLPIGQTSPYKSDNYYADINGDTLADLNLGRFPCASQAQCSVMMAKTLAYERWPYLNDTAWFRKATTIQADTFPTNHPDTTIYYQRDGVAFVCSLLINAGFVQIDTFLPDDNAASVIQALNQGRSYLLYTGHGYGDRWQFPFVIDPETGSLQNGTKLPVIVSWSCKTVFYTTNSLGERWLKVGTTNNPKGAVAYLGTTADGTAPYRSPVARNFFRSVLEDRPLRLFINLGKAFNEGRDSLWHIAYPYTTTTERHRRYVEWNLLGDPALQLWTEVPKSMIVEHPAAIEMDVPIDLEVLVKDSASQLPIQGALVTLYKPDGITPEVFQSEVTDIEGEAIFENLTVPSSGTMYVTATLGNYVPYQGEIQVYQMMTDNPLALAYNGNRHLVRTPNSEELHLVYTRGGEVVYRHSSNGGTDWALPVTIGAGEFPTLALAVDNLPSVAWTDEEGGLWYRRKTSTISWSDIYHLDNPTSSVDLHLNSPPSIAIHGSNPNTVHILVTRSGLIPRHRYAHTLEDFAFPINDPGQGWFDIIEEKLGPLEPPLRLFPSIARCEVNNSLHATWQRVDTICYATKPRNDPWVNWGAPFELDGLQSAHPFVETYGDSVFVVWQHLDPSTMKEDIYRGARHISYSFSWANLSQTPLLYSLDPVSASGFFTIYAEEPTISSPYDIYYKVNPYDDRINISSTSYNSRYPQCVARFTLDPYLYTAWLDRDSAPYEIRFRKIRHLTHPDMAYLSSSNGLSLSSPYLVARDSFIDGWQIPVDMGNMATTYQFRLIPGYAYKAKAVVYHEASGPWSGCIKIDNNLQFTVTYNANVPETLECWIPPALYEDSLLTVSFNRIAGDFAAIGPIYIYRYEYEGGGGPMSQQSQPTHHASITVFPNPFSEKLNITYQTASQNKTDLKIYDVTGRLVRQFALPSRESFNHITWDGIDDRGRAVPQGVYFLRIDNPDSGDIFCQKVLRIK